jgi:hypothetical protein
LSPRRKRQCEFGEANEEEISVLTQKRPLVRLLQIGLAHRQRQPAQIVAIEGKDVEGASPPITNCFCLVLLAASTIQGQRCSSHGRFG